jgi:tRNA threonylcarbamoyladenosine biosynthesis protein TsaB
MAPELSPLILAIETATRAGSVALVRGGQVLASVSGDSASSHSNDLIENIETALDQTGRELPDVDLFAAAIGPGSFTGLRIGLATVKSLAVSMRRKCAGISTLAAVARAAGDSHGTVALLPAGRGEVFAQMFAVRDGGVEPLDAAVHIKPPALLERYAAYSRLIWAGEGSHLQRELLERGAEALGLKLELNGEHPGQGWILARQTELASAVAILALQEWRAHRLVEPHDLRANYLRASDAEINANA